MCLIIKRFSFSTVFYVRWMRSKRRGLLLGWQPHGLIHAINTRLEGSPYCVATHPVLGLPYLTACLIVAPTTCTCTLHTVDIQIGQVWFIYKQHVLQ